MNGITYQELYGALAATVQALAISEARINDPASSVDPRAFNKRAFTLASVAMRKPLPERPDTDVYHPQDNSREQSTEHALRYRIRQLATELATERTLNFSSQLADCANQLHRALYPDASARTDSVEDTVYTAINIIRAYHKLLDKRTLRGEPRDQEEKPV